MHERTVAEAESHLATAIDQARRLLDEATTTAAATVASAESRAHQIAERVLGMPGEVRMDKDVPFEQLK